MEPIEIDITRERLEHLPDWAFTHPQCGSQLEFRGLVRAEEKGSPIDALEYEAYVPMAREVLRTLTRDLLARHACLGVRVIHRMGVVPVGDAAILVKVCSRHRQEGLRFLQEFMDQLKETVPIWKVRALACSSANSPLLPRPTPHSPP